MSRTFDQIALLLLTAWVGALWAIGGLAAPLIFHTLADKMVAGNLAGQMFEWLSYFGIFTSFFLMIQRLVVYGLQACKQGYYWIVVAMLLLVLAGQFGIKPILAQLKSQAGAVDVMQSVFADRFRNWHGIASVAYLIECFLGVALVLKAR